jgi:hypothetical protein
MNGLTTQQYGTPIALVSSVYSPTGGRGMIEYRS